MSNTNQLKPLQHPDNLHLQAAQGWLELGNHREAETELERISASSARHPDVLDLRWQISAKERKWVACVDIAEAVIQSAPDRPEGWIHRSFALHEMRRTQEALDKLLPAAGTFPKVWTIPYNLACYCAQLGRLGECKTWIGKAMAIDERTVKLAAVDDPDLKPLRDLLSDKTGKQSERGGI